MASGPHTHGNALIVACLHRDGERNFGRIRQFIRHHYNLQCMDCMRLGSQDDVLNNHLAQLVRMEVIREQSGLYRLPEFIVDITSSPTKRKSPKKSDDGGPTPSKRMKFTPTARMKTGRPV